MMDYYEENRFLHIFVEATVGCRQNLLQIKQEHLTPVVYSLVEF